MKHTAAQVADAAGVSLELTQRLWTAMGFPQTPSPDDAAFTDDDVRAVRFVGELIRSGSMEEDAIVQLARTMASSVARVADAQVEVAVDRARRFGKDDVALVDQTVVDQTPWLLGYMWRRHAEVALRRAYETGDDASMRAVGFADLVGFTQMSQTLPEDELSHVIDRFVLLANDVVVLGGGRVIKTIGDEVMFDAPDGRSALEIALTLAERYRDDDELSDVRVGLASGDVLAHDGDLFGPPVNLAARIVAVARPGSVVIPESIHAVVADDPAYRFRTLRPRFLKGIGRVSLYRVRRAG